MLKRYILFIVLSFVVFLLYAQLFPPRRPEKAPAEETPGEEAETPPSPGTEEGPSEEVEAPPPVEPPPVEPSPSVEKPTVTAEERDAEEEVWLKNEYCRMRLTKFGAAIREIVLYTTETNKDVVIHGAKPVRIPGKTLKEEWNPLAITSSKGKGLDLSSHSFALKEGTLRKAVYELTLDGGLTVTKSFELAKYDYVVTLDVTFQNASAKLLHVGDHQVRVGTVLPLDLKAGYRNISFMALGAGKVQKFSPKPDKERSKLFSFLRWASAGNKYFALILSPKQGKGKYEVVPQVPKTSGAAVFPGKASSKNERDYCYSLGVAVEGFDLEPGDTIVHRYSFYAGPKEYDRLKRLSRSFTGDPQFEKVMRFGWFGFVGVPLLKVLKGCYGLIPNYGLAIIVLTVLIKIILYPLDQKSYKSMKEMQKVQPLIAELKKKYKDDPRQAQVEQMKLFKEHKVNPLGGCLPMLLQMPVLFAMFQMIRSAVELRGAPFVLWIKDLSQPDAILDFGVEIPIIGHTLNILPLLLVLSFVAQTKISKLGTTAAQQDPQQKMMGHMMTVIFGIIFYNLPSGLTLYFAISTVLRSVQQYYVQKRA